MTGTRKITATLALAFLVAVLALDLAAGIRPDPFAAPPILALGSGAAASGAHCSALPD